MTTTTLLRHVPTGDLRLPAVRSAARASSPERRGGPSRLETLLFRIATAVIGLHVADDNFIQPNPGTSPADHLSGGLIPLAILLALALGYPRMRPAARGLASMLTGLFGVVVGIEALYYTGTVGPSGDDFTGLLSIPAGLALLPLGAATLWRGRRLDGSLPRRVGRRTLFGAGAAVFVALGVVPMLFGYVYTHVARSYVPDAELGVPYKDVTFETSDGLELEGWYIPSKNGAAVISFPGRKGQGTQRRARFLARQGYGVLLFDRRGEGESEGDPNSYGWDGDRDVKAAIDYLRSRPDVEDGRIGGIGLSVGGELLLETAAETPALRAVVSEGAGQRSYREARHLTGAGALTFLPMAAAVTVYSGHTPPPDLSELVSRIEQPTLLIHGRHSQGGEERKYNRLYDEAGGSNVKRWEIADSGHTGGLDAAPQQYERRVIDFFDRSLLDN